MQIYRSVSQKQHFAGNSMRCFAVDDYEMYSQSRKTSTALEEKARKKEIFKAKILNKKKQLGRELTKDEQQKIFRSVYYISQPKNTKSEEEKKKEYKRKLAKYEYTKGEKLTPAECQMIHDEVYKPNNTKKKPQKRKMIYRNF